MRKFLSALPGIALIGGVVLLPRSSAALSASDFLKASGQVVRNNSGNGSIVNLRGTNLGGWLLQEGWMSPNGEATLVRTGMSARASQNSGNATRALDGDATTRWDTGAPQASGQSFVVDLGAMKSWDQISLDAGSSTGDFPVNFTIAASDDNTNWRTVKTVTGNTAQHVFVHTSDQRSRFVRVTLNSGKGNWWSIAEFYVYVSDEFNTRRVLTSRFGTAAANSLIDGYHDTWITTADLDNIASMGMNLVRVPIHWLVIMNPDGTMRSDADAFRSLDWVVSQASARGLYVMLDLHGAPGAACPWQSCGQAGTNELWTNATDQSWTVQIWQRIAARYRGNPAVAAYDLLNEPLVSMGATENSTQVQQKFNFYDRLFDAVRAVDPDHMIVVAAFFSFGQALSPATFGWTNVMYQTHHYNFGQFSDSNAQNQLIENGINDIVNFKQAWNVPVFAGEFWFFNFNDLYGKWLSALNANNVSWANWAYKNRNAPDHLDDGGMANGVNWGFYLNDQNAIPDLQNDSSSTIATKWSRFATSNFQAQNAFINVFGTYTQSPGWSSLRSMANNQFVSADNAGNSPLIANRGSAQGWETFQIISNPDGTVSLASAANFRYVTADLNNGGRLIAAARGVLGWEKFSLVNNGDGTFSLRSTATNQFVSADLNQGGVLFANRATIGAWEKLVIAGAPAP